MDPTVGGGPGSLPPGSNLMQQYEHENQLKVKKSKNQQ